jgi:hypothetical protein
MMAHLETFIEKKVAKDERVDDLDDSRGDTIS